MIDKHSGHSTTDSTGDFYSLDVGSIPAGRTKEFMMKKYLYPCVAFFLVYLLGAFISVDFNISNWYMEVRFMVAVIGAASFVMSLVAAQ